MSRLTPAERAAIDAIARHGTVKAAAFALGKSTRTVEQQLAKARERLGVDTTVQVVWRTRLEVPPIEGADQ